MAPTAYITRTASFFPGPAVDNDNIETVLGMVGGKPSRARGPVLRSNGIKSRHYAVDPATGLPTHSNAALAAEAVRALAGDGFSLGDIDCLACGTSMADQIMPSHGSMVHGELGNPPCEVMTATGICLSGFAALKYAVMGVRSGDFNHAVAAASERSSAMMRGHFFDHDQDTMASELEKRPSLAFEKDFLRFMLSDGAGAFLVEPRPSSSGQSLRVEWMFERSYANEMPACMYAGAERREDGRLTGWLEQEPGDWLAHSTFAVKQDARLLNEHIIHYTVERGLTAVQKKYGLNAAQVDWFLPHYSSHYFRDKLAAGMARVNFCVPMEKWFTNLATRGNTGSASMYLMVAELAASGQLSHGQRLLCYVPESGRFSTGFLLLTVCDPGRE